MSAVVGEVSVVDAQNVKMSAPSASSVSSNPGPKTSMFAKKVGFVIPKNKLGGSLVPIFKGGKKPGGNDAANEESNNQLQRKTKWEPDLTQDAAVKKGRALAYETRVDQITQLLKSGTLQPGGDQNSQAVDQHVDPESSSMQIDSASTKLLEVEKMQAIGEILKLNPGYKAPPDYKPLLKEAAVSIPVKDNTGFSFVSLIIGPKSETLKRLEKETGAKMLVIGTKSVGEKVELSSDDIENHEVYETLTVHLSAETYEKLDTATAVIELLLASVTGNSAIGTYSNDCSHNRDLSMHTTAGPAQTPQHGHLMYPGSQFSEATPEAHWSLPSGHVSSHNIPSASLNNPILSHSSLIRPTTPPSFQSRPVSAPGASVPQQQLLPQISHAGSFLLPSSEVLLPFNSSQSQQPNPSVVERTLTSPSTLPSVQQPNMPLVPVGSSSTWSGSPAGRPTNLGPVNMGQIPHSTGPWSVVTQAGFTPFTPPNMAAAANIVSAINLLLRQSSTPFSNFPVNHSTASESFTLRQPTLTASSTRDSGDFTFQPYHHQNPVPQAVPRMSNMPTTQAFPRPMMPANQTSIPHVPFLGNPTSLSFSQVPPAFRNPSPIAPHVSVTPSVMNHANKHPSMQGAFPPGPGDGFPVKLKYPMPMTQGNFVPPNQQFIGRPSFPPGRPAANPGGQQIYDPFSPTSV